MVTLRFNNICFDFFANFQQHGYATSSLSKLKVFQGKLKDGNDLNVLYFKNVPNDEHINQVVRKETMEEFINETFSVNSKFELEPLLENKWIKFIVLYQEKGSILGLTCFMSTASGHYCPLVGVASKHRGKGYGR